MSAALQTSADKAWAEHGVAAREFVGIGFEDAGGLLWYELPNNAGVGEFLVDGDDVRAVVQQARVDLGDAVFAEAARVLWHSHYIAIEPSKADMDNFPAWLVDYGMVYHAPTGVTTLYKPVEHLHANSPASPALPTPEVAEDGR